MGGFSFDSLGQISSNRVNRVTPVQTTDSDIYIPATNSYKPYYFFSVWLDGENIKSTFYSTTAEAASARAAFVANLH